MKFNKINPNNSRLNSYQFQLSQKIFGKRISLNLNRDEAAKLTGLSLSTYTEVEQGIDFSYFSLIFSRKFSKSICPDKIYFTLI